MPIVITSSVALQRATPSAKKRSKSLARFAAAIRTAESADASTAIETVGRPSAMMRSPSPVAETIPGWSRARAGSESRQAKRSVRRFMTQRTKTGWISAIDAHFSPRRCGLFAVKRR